jgi:type IV pilus assembly protein PilC
MSTLQKEGCFQYVAVKIGGQDKVQGTIQAANEREARELLREKNLQVLSMKSLDSSDDSFLNFAKKQAQSNQVLLWIGDKLSWIGLKEKILFTQNVGLMLRAGLPITEILLYMELYVKNPKFKLMLIETRQNIMVGMSMSAALARYPSVFDEVFVGIVRAGEASGELEVVLERLYHLLLTAQKLRKQVISALIYPAILVGLMVIVLCVMFLFVIPTFTNIYKQMGIELPFITQVMMGISDFMVNYWLLLLGVVGGGSYGLWRFIQTPVGKEKFDAVLIQIPVVRALVQYVSISNFIATLQVSFASGLPITDCMHLACRTVTHTQIRSAMESVGYQIQTGQRFAPAMAQTGLMPDMVMIMLSTGEESGELDKMLCQALEFLEEEVSKRVEILMSLMEPLLLLVMGGVVLVLALSIYMPLFSMYEHI